MNSFRHQALAALLACLLMPLAAAADVNLYDVFDDGNFITYLKNVAYVHNKVAIDAAITDGSYVSTRDKDLNPLNKNIWRDEDFAIVTKIQCSGRGIEDLGEFNRYFVNLTTLDCSHNNLTSVDISGLDALKEYDCTYNNLTSLHISDMPVLWSVKASQNRIADISLSNCPRLSFMELYQNCISVSVMSAFMRGLPNYQGNRDAGITPSEAVIRYIQPQMVDDTEHPEQNEVTNQHIKQGERKRWYLKSWRNGWEYGSYYGDYTWLDAYANVTPRTISIAANDPTDIADELLRKYIREVAYLDNQGLIDEARSNGDYYPYNGSSENPFWSEKITEDDLYWLRTLNLHKWNEANRGDAERLITDLTGIKQLYMLEHLEVTGHKLESLDVSGMENLHTLRCDDQKLDDPVSTDPVSSEGRLTSLDVTGCKTLHQIYCDHNDLTSIDVSTCGELREFRLNNNPNLESLDVTHNPDLIWLDCYNCLLPSLDVTQNTKLQRLYCYETRDGEGTGDPAKTRRGYITGLDLTHCPDLWELRITNNPFTDLDLSRNNKMEILYCNDMDMNKAFDSNGDNMLQKNLKYMPELRQLSCFGDTLQALDVSQNKKLSRLICFKNDLKVLYLDENLELDTLICGENQAGYDVRNVPYQNGGNKLTTLDLSKNTKLTYLACAKNWLTELDVSNQPLLKYLNYDEQIRTVEAWNALCVKYGDDGKKEESSNVYYLRMDKNTSDGDHQILRDRMIVTDHPDEKHDIGQRSFFDIDRVNTQYSGTWANFTDKTGGSSVFGDDNYASEAIFKGTRSGAGAPRRAGTSADLLPEDVVGDILVLYPLTETETSVTGTVRYKYDVSLNAAVDPAVDQHTYFVLNWYTNPQVITGVDELPVGREVAGVTYHNLAGQSCDRPFEGVNIVVTRYSDGTTATSKLLR